MAFRYDRGEILRVRKTPQGGLRLDAALTRTGVFEYRNPDGSIRRELRPEDEVFHADSLATLGDAPVTHLHPQSMVTPETWEASRVVGHVAGQAQREKDLIVAEIVIQGGDVIKEIQSKKLREVSCGYECSMEDTGGRTDSGEAYDVTQRGIRYNHVALVPKGRAGSKVRLRLDADGNQPTPGNQPDMKIEIINGTEYEVGTPAHAQAVAERKDAEEQRQADLEELETLRAQAENFESRVQERVRVLGLAEKFNVKVEEGATDRQIKEAILTKIDPSLTLEGRSDDWLEGRLDAAIESEPKGNAAKVRTKIEERTDAPVQPTMGKDEEARAKMVANLRNKSAVGHGPQAVTRG